MRIDKALNLVIPVERDDGPIYVHSTPISREVFERYFLVISKTFTEIYAQGIGQLAGPRVAAMMLKQVSGDQWPQVEQGLMNEIRRLSSVLIQADGAEQKWETAPLQEALDKGWMDADEVSEVENALVFFTVASAMHRSNQRPVIAGALSMWDAAISSQTCMELKASLQTSTATDSSGEKVKPSSIPS